MEALRAAADPAGEGGIQALLEAAGDEEELPTPGMGEESPDDDRPGAGDRGDEGAPDGAATRFPRPTHVRGIYLNAWTAGSRSRRGRLFDLVRRTELNTVVIDIKDATGYVSHPSQVPLAREVGATNEVRIRDLPALLGQLEEAGIYPIARIVVAKDPPFRLVR